MPLLQPVPVGSVYVWCYVQGLRGVGWNDVLLALATHGISPRDKDHRNWSDGARKYLGMTYTKELVTYPPSTLLSNAKAPIDPRAIPNLDSYPDLVCNSVAYEESRWVPCNEENYPIVAWSTTRNTINEARLWPGCKYLAENLKGCRWVVLDFDIDHDKDNLNWELREFGQQLLSDFPTQALYKPGWMGFHLTYWTNKEIVTRHLPHVCIDICGNSTDKSGQLRYFKTKKANDVPTSGLLTEAIWSRLQEYSLTKDVYRKVKNNELIN